jgi:two-component system, OmpR family, response regulator
VHPAFTPRELAVLGVFLDAGGRVVSRRELTRRSGLRDASPRRVDAVIVGLRRKLGDDAVRTVRGRGWLLVDDRIGGPT